MKTLIAIPCMDMVHTSFFTSVVAMRKIGTIEVAVTSSSLIYDARNNLAQRAVENGFDRILWLDSDMHFEPDLMERFMARLDEGLEFVTGLYFSRKPPSKPVVYQNVSTRDAGGGAVIPVADPFKEIPEGLFEVAGCGFGGCMMTVDLLRAVNERYGLPFSPILGFGEDLSFCTRARQLGAVIVCDGSIRLGHVGYHEYTIDDWEKGDT